MEPFFKFLKKSLVAMVFVMFATVATWVPIPHQNNIETAEAAWATVANQAIDYVIQGFKYIEDLAINAATTISSVVDKALLAKDVNGDGLAWAVAKRMLSVMLKQITTWIKSGFNGRPMFVQDMEGYMKEVADGVFNGFLDELGSVGSFLCDPFQLDIQLALSLNFQAGLNREEITCSLTGVVGNLNDFMSGARGTFTEGGWNNWFQVTSDPGTYTPQGAYFTARSQLAERIAAAQDAERENVSNGNGFLSQKLCEPTSGADGVERNICDIVTPGNIIADQINTNLASENSVLVEADEINEVFIALLGQVSSKLFSGSNSLLDL